MSFSKKGRRKDAMNSIKKAEKAMKEFNKVLYSMNGVYHILKDDDTLTKENIKDKIAAVSDFKFTAQHISMLESDLLR